MIRKWSMILCGANPIIGIPENVKSTKNLQNIKEKYTKIGQCRPSFIFLLLCPQWTEMNRKLVQRKVRSGFAPRRRHLA